MLWLLGWIFIRLVGIRCVFPLFSAMLPLFELGWDSDEKLTSDGWHRSTVRT